MIVPSRSGFTFIELLVATAIMVILMAVVVVSFRGANKSGRDARRKSEMQIIKGKLENYRLEKGVYPGVVGTTSRSNSGVFLQGLQPDYLDKNYDDPLGPDDTYNYTYQHLDRDGCSYALIARMEVTANAQVCPASCGLTMQGNEYCVTD